MFVGNKSINVNCFVTNSQFDLFKISLVYGKSSNHFTIHDRYNIELPSETVQLVCYKSWTEECSLRNEKIVTSTIHYKNICCKRGFLREIVMEDHIGWGQGVGGGMSDIFNSTQPMSSPPRLPKSARYDMKAVMSKLSNQQLV